LVLADRQVDELGVRGKRTAPYKIQRLGLLGERDPAVSIGEGVRGVAHRLWAVFRFKPGIIRSLVEEVRERHLEIAQRLLKHHRTDLGEKPFLRFLLPFGQFRGGHLIADRFLLLPPSRGSIFQGLIGNVSGAAEGLGELRRLLIRREESVFERLLDYHEGILHRTGKYCQAG